MKDKALEELMEKNSAFEISYTKTVTVPWEDIDDIVCTMIECGGSSYPDTYIPLGGARDGRDETGAQDH